MTATRTLRIGTRASALARTQTDTVVTALGTPVEIVPIVTEELGNYLAEQHQLAVAPTVTALRARANQVIEAELARLYGRLADADDNVRREVAVAVRRAVEKVLHAPTVRVKELASTPEGDQYANALRELFDLDPATVESVAAVRKTGGPA